MTVPHYLPPRVAKDVHEQASAVTAFVNARAKRKTTKSAVTESDTTPPAEDERLSDIVARLQEDTAPTSRTSVKHRVGLAARVLAGRK